MYYASVYTVLLLAVSFYAYRYFRERAYLRKIGHWPNPEVSSIDEDGFMVPLWVKYPNLPRHSMGWRMGCGESYKWEWMDWYNGVGEKVRKEYKEKYLPPKEWEGYLD